MCLTIPDNDKGRRLLKGLQKPSRKAKVNETIPDGYDFIERLTKRIEILEKLLMGYQKIVIEYAEQVEGLKLAIQMNRNYKRIEKEYPDLPEFEKENEDGVG